MNTIKKIKLATAITAGIALAGCGSDSDSDEIVTPIDDTPVVDACAAPVVCTDSGFILSDDAIYVAADAADGTDITDAINFALFDIADDAVLVLPKGDFIVSNSILIEDANGITITGHGKTSTNLDFSNSIGDDGIRFTSGVNVTIRDLAVYEAPKNAIKADGANGVHITDTAAIWVAPLEDGDDSTHNGAYGLYPVSSQNVLMENNYSYGSADAGIYVGQSNNIVVRNNIAEQNVAGIEIENSTMADVYNNIAHSNSAGILSFDLPGLPQAYGGGVRIFNNTTHHNNTENVGAGAVSIAPPGTGILIFATSDVEIYNNVIEGNDTSAIEISSYFLADDDVANFGTNYGITMGDGWSPLIKNIYMHDNTIIDNGANPRGTLLADIIAGYSSPFNSTGEAQRFPAILYGGIGELLSNADALVGFDAIVGEDAKADGVDYDAYSADDLICVDSNINDSVLDLNVGLVYGTDATDASNFNGANPAATLRIDQMDNNSLINCTLPRLEAAVVTFKGVTYGCTGDDIDEPACAL